jgi:uncharacterized coiled-coil protein SlyX
MRRIPQLLLAIVVLVLGAATVGLFSLYQKSTTSLETARSVEQSTRDQYAQAVSAIAEIQDSLETMMPEGERLPVSNPSFSDERAMNGASSGEVLERIAALRTRLQHHQERIEKLEADLKKSGTRIDGMEKMIANLRRILKQKEGELDQLAASLTEVRDTLRVHDEMLVDRQRELATVYYVEGPKKELLKSGVIVAKGGVLGVGKTLKPSANIPEPLLSTLNTDEERVVRLDAKKAQVVSAQPVSSYQLLLVDGKMELHILDPAEFRKVRQLVIVTA